MNMADPDASEATDVAPAEAPPSPSSPSGASGTSVNRQATSAEGVFEAGVPRGCPFLLSESGGWRLNTPARDHRCTAVAPAAALSLEKQARLCLTAAHTSCATYVASVSARGDRIGTTRVTSQATRWALARTTTVIEDAGGLRSRILGLVLDRGRWPAIPAVILVATLIVLAISGLQGGGTTPIATTSPTHLPTPAPTSRPTVVPTTTPEPQATPTPAPPSAAPSPTPVKTAKPTATFRTYRVKSGDTLSGIATQFGTTSFAIAALNGISVSSILRVGQVLKIPNP